MPERVGRRPAPHTRPPGEPSQTAQLSELRPLPFLPIRHDREALVPQGHCGLAYATTVHKSRDSEYPAVAIPLTTQHYPMLQRNLLYTAVTRGKRLVVIVGQKKAMAIAVKGNQTRRRRSKLREWLASAV